MRFIVAIICGLIVAFGLFLLMHDMISGQSAVNANTQANTQLINFVRVKRQQQLRHKKYQKPQKPKQQKKPPPENVKVSKTQHPHVQTPQMNVPHLNTTIGTGGSGPFLGSGSFGQGGPGGAAEGDVIPLVQIEPQYPREAAINGLEGSVTLQFTINPDGTVSDPSVVKSSNRVFNSAARRAILKWKFKPRVVNGKAVSRTATETIQFNLNKNQ